MTKRKLLSAIVLVALLMFMGASLAFADHVAVTPPGQGAPVHNQVVGTPCNCPGPTYPGAAENNPSGVAVFDSGSPACSMDHPPRGPFSPPDEGQLERPSRLLAVSRRVSPMSIAPAV